MWDSSKGLGRTPRFNHKVNNLIYWAEGDGSSKRMLQEAGKLDDYFDSSDNYSRFLVN